MNPIECPRCGEITLVGRKDVDLVTYECPCGHEQNQLQDWWFIQDQDDNWIAQEIEYDRNN